MTKEAQVLNLPNLLTLSRIVATPLFLAMLLADDVRWHGASVVVFLLASLTDLYDGRLARTRDCVTQFGRFMDPLADKILVTSALVAFVIIDVVNGWIVLPIVVRDVVITGMRLYGLYQGRMMETSILAKWKTTVQLAAVILILVLLATADLTAHYSGSAALAEASLLLVSNVLMAVVLLLTLATGFHYFLRTGSA